MPTLQVNGIEVNYTQEGQGDPLVLVHNLIASSRAYDFNAPVFAKYFRTIRYDLRGHGLSSRTESWDEKNYYTFDNLAEDLYQLLKALNVDSCYLLGQAYWGVGIITSFYARH
ncbi:MAG TPA: alpha/beta fold hydrolase, partial [Dehalococcoidia bacterium]|nr:alpha/beta fold hydrolase [Dehalococcoidia bacterium]